MTPDEVAYFSNAPLPANNQANAQGDYLLDLMAPGYWVVSSVAYPANTYAAYAGTSMAAPQVAGGWALLKQYAPSASVAQVLGWMRAGGTTIVDSRNGLAVPRMAVAGALRAGGGLTVATATATATAMATATVVDTSVPTAVNTAVPTATIVDTAIPTAVNTTVPTPVDTAVPTAVNTAVPTDTTIPTATATATRTATATATNNPALSPTRTATNTRQPTNTRPPTYTRTATKTATPLPAYMTRVANGNFEGGHTNWSESSTNFSGLISNDTRIKARSGSYYAWLGGGNNETSVLSQDISVQSDATFLRMYYMLNSGEQCGKRYDTAQVSVNGITLPAGTIELCNRNNARTWTAKTFNLSAYIGQTVTFSIKVTTDTTVVSSLWIDDVGFIRRAGDSIESDDRSSGEHVNTRSTIR
jgi:hypothetical protein